MKVAYEELKKLAQSLKPDLIEQRLTTPKERKVRRKPRDTEKIELLRQSALAKNERYKPFFREDGVLILPFFLK
jgi:hypothetical protein